MLPRFSRTPFPQRPTTNPAAGTAVLDVPPPDSGVSPPPAVAEPQPQARRPASPKRPGKLIRLRSSTKRSSVISICASSIGST